MNTTLCYIEQDGKYLMLHRIRKKNDVNKDKWIGIGGKFEQEESPEDCLLREVREETGLTLESWRYAGIVTFISEGWGTEYMHLFHADSFSGTLREKDTEEGVLEWIEKHDLLSREIWPGDRIFLRLLDEQVPFFSLKLRYTAEGQLVEAVLNAKSLPL